MFEIITGISYVLIILVIGYVFRHLIDKQSKKLEERIANTNKQIKDSNASFDGLKAVLKHQMLDLTIRCEQRGFTTNEECDYFQSILDCYLQLGGNNIVPRLEKRFFGLPSSEKIRRERPDLYKTALVRENNWIYDTVASAAQDAAHCCRMQLIANPEADEEKEVKPGKCHDCKHNCDKKDD